MSVPAVAPGALTSFAALRSYLRGACTAFRVRADDVVILSQPNEFFRTLRDGVAGARKRVSLTSLYLGTGSHEREIVGCCGINRLCIESVASLGAAACRIGAGGAVQVVLDYMRGSRGDENSRTMLAPLVAQHSNVRVALYHTPDLGPLLRRVIPERFNETVGVQHVKAYVWDDTVLLSGANMSDSYFTNRQDRYVLIRNAPKVADFFVELSNRLAMHSFALDGDGRAKGPNPHPVHNPREFKAAARDSLLSLLPDGRLSVDDVGGVDDNSGASAVKGEGETLLFPLLQMGPFGIRHDENVTAGLFRGAPAGGRACIGSGYFNLTRRYIDALLSSPAEFDILTAAPRANGFFGAKGIAGLVPAAYTHIERSFLKQAAQRSRAAHVRVHEYFRPEWTFHGKGLWLWMPGEHLPCMSLIGSPNFGYRSVYRDIEAQVAILTRDDGLRARLNEEQRYLFEPSTPATLETLSAGDRVTSRRVALAAEAIKSFF